MRAQIALSVLLIISGAPSLGQKILGIPPEASKIASDGVPTGHSAQRHVIAFCPGEFPTNVMVQDCSFREGQRWDNFVISSVTDQAMLGSVAGALGSQLISSPAEWPRTWQYYGYRLATSYSGGVARGIVELTIGSIAHSDPRHVQCAEDPLTYAHFNSQIYEHCYGLKGQAFYRPLHVFTDALTVRHSQPDGMGGRYPAFERFVGIYANAYASYPWQPGVENNFAAVSRRAGMNYLFTFLGSTWAEYGPSITARFHRTPTLKVGP